MIKQIFVNILVHLKVVYHLKISTLKLMKIYIYKSLIFFLKYAIFDKMPLMFVKFIYKILRFNHFLKSKFKVFNNGSYFKGQTNTLKLNFIYPFQ